MMNLSLAQVKKFGSEIQSLKTKHDKAIRKVDDVVEHGVDASLASATAFGLGIWQTRADHQKLLGVPVDLAFGLAAHAAGFMGMGGKAAASVIATPRPRVPRGVDEESKTRLRGPGPLRPQLSEAMRGV